MFFFWTAAGISLFLCLVLNLSSYSLLPSPICPPSHHHRSSSRCCSTNWCSSSSSRTSSSCSRSPPLAMVPPSLHSPPLSCPVAAVEALRARAPSLPTPSWRCSMRTPTRRSHGWPRKPWVWWGRRRHDRPSLLCLPPPLFLLFSCFFLNKYAEFTRGSACRSADENTGSRGARVCVVVGVYASACLLVCLLSCQWTSTHYNRDVSISPLCSRAKPHIELFGADALKTAFSFTELFIFPSVVCGFYFSFFIFILVLLKSDDFHSMSLVAI